MIDEIFPTFNDFADLEEEVTSNGEQGDANKSTTAKVRIIQYH